jgi:hypothetical protein
MKREHYHGYPLPDDTCELVVHPRFPLYESMNGVTVGGGDEDRHGPVIDTRKLVGAGIKHGSPHTWTRVNQWFCKSDQTTVCVYRSEAGRHFCLQCQSGTGSRAERLLMTIGVSRNWDLDAELVAQQKLFGMLREHAVRDYIFTGMFMELSKRSGIMYIFRRCRPTLAISMNQGAPAVLCALCMHAIGYYDGTFAGGMVPTDDVIAHLTLMRGDEHYYWKSCNQHSPWLPEAGL